MKTYSVIADTHFGHANIIKFCNIPFNTVQEMGVKLIQLWNETVNKNDVVFMLGDFAFGKDIIPQIVPLLNGEKILIKGNHDTYPNEFYRKCGFKEVSKYPILFDFYLMSHEPLQLSETTPYFNFYGHVHNDNKYIDNATSKCVSVERIGYRPYNFMRK